MASAVLESAYLRCIICISLEATLIQVDFYVHEFLLQVHVFAINLSNKSLRLTWLVIQMCLRTRNELFPAKSHVRRQQ